VIIVRTPEVFRVEQPEYRLRGYRAGVLSPLLPKAIASSKAV
jgi:hypothetical protein